MLHETIWDDTLLLLLVKSNSNFEIYIDFLNFQLSANVIRISLFDMQFQSRNDWTRLLIYRKEIGESRPGEQT